MSEITPEVIIEAAKQAAAKQDGPLSRADFERITGISQYHIYKAFPEGGWSEVKKRAYLERHPQDKRPLSDEDLLQEFHRVATELGSIPNWLVFSSRAEISADVVRRRFGGLRGTLRKYREWLSVKHPDSPLLDELQAQSVHEIPLPPEIIQKEEPAVPQQWEKISGPEFGAPLDFRGLRHAPINEQGVVYLFGMISYELGFIVEAIHTTFPDCEAKRCIDRRRNRWQRVRIEFEYKSSNFNHDPLDCDLIVCWEHDWPGCPLEVLELRSVINELEG
jgi:hypothetical protein